MELTQQPPGGANHIQSVTEAKIRIDGQEYGQSIILTAETLISDWPVNGPEDLSAEHMTPILDLRPEVVLIGTGKDQVFLDPSLLVPFYRNGVGVEMMNTQAACRTFNVLISDNRKVAAALLPPGA